MSLALKTRPHDSRFFWDNNSSRPESQRILLVNHCHTSGKIIYNLYISLVLCVCSRYLAWQFGVLSEPYDEESVRNLRP